MLYKLSYRLPSGGDAYGYFKSRTGAYYAAGVMAVQDCTEIRVQKEKTHTCDNCGSATRETGPNGFCEPCEENAGPWDQTAYLP